MAKSRKLPDFIPPKGAHTPHDFSLKIGAIMKRKAEGISGASQTKTELGQFPAKKKEKPRKKATRPGK